jgi:hypothetical protein
LNTNNDSAYKADTLKDEGGGMRDETPPPHSSSFNLSSFILLIRLARLIALIEVLRQIHFAHPTGTDLKTMRKALTLSMQDIVSPGIKHVKMITKISLG